MLVENLTISLVFPKVECVSNSLVVFHQGVFLMGLHKVEWCFHTGSHKVERCFLSAFHKVEWHYIHNTCMCFIKLSGISYSTCFIKKELFDTLFHKVVCFYTIFQNVELCFIQGFIKLRGFTKLSGVSNGFEVEVEICYLIKLSAVSYRVS